MSKELFTKQASVYAKYRPSYPDALFEYIMQYVSSRNHAWDCATGNGQAALALARYFQKVEATDHSAQQLQHAVPRQNINYHKCAAEQTPFNDNSFDLITVAQAYHWLDWKKFAEEASRVGKPDATIAIWGYNLFISTDEALNELLRKFYYDIVGPYWDKARKFVDEAYRTVDFPFQELPSAEFSHIVTWTKEDLLGYLSSWSAVQQFKDHQGRSPLDFIQTTVDQIWTSEENKQVRFPLFLRIGRIIK